MAENFTGTLTVASQLNLVEDGAISSPSDILTRSYGLTFANGQGALKAQNMYHAQLVIAPSATTQLNLSTGLTNELGTALAFANIKGMLFAASDDNVGDINVKPAAANGFSSWLVGGVGGLIIQSGMTNGAGTPSIAGFAVTAGTGDLLDVENTDGSNSGTIDVIIWGETV